MNVLQNQEILLKKSTLCNLILKLKRNPILKDLEFSDCAYLDGFKISLNNHHRLISDMCMLSCDDISIILIHEITLLLQNIIEEEIKKT